MPNQFLPGVIAIPSSLLITNITRSNPMVVTVAVGNSTTESNTFIPGMSVRLVVPYKYGMFQANNLVGTIQTIVSNDWTLNIDSSLFDAFTIPSGNVEAPATVSPNGSRNLTYGNETKKVPFQSLNNIGN